MLYAEPGGYYEQDIAWDKPVVACVVGRWKSKLTRAVGHAGVVDDAAHVNGGASAAPRTSSEALGNATLPFGLALADRGLEALTADIHLARGLNVLRGQITHPAVAQALGKPFADPFGVWAASGRA